MKSVNKLQDPAATARMLQEFEKQNMKMDMTDEMSKLLLIRLYLSKSLLTYIISFSKRDIRRRSRGK